MKRSGPILILAAVLFLLPLAGGALRIDATPITLADYLADFPHPKIWPTGSHFLLALPILILLAITWWQKRVVPLPKPTITMALGVFVLTLALSLSVSNYKYQTLTAFLEWSCVAAMLVTVVALAGRERGPRGLISALAVGSLISALMGIREFATMRSMDPNWRVFGGWFQPNIYAGMLVIGVFAATGASYSWARVPRLLFSLAAGLILFAVTLTQSRGALLSFAPAWIVMLALLAWWTGWRRLGPALAPVLIAAVLVAGLKFAPAPGGQAALSRVESANATQEHSGEFRKLLWKTSLQIAKEHPAGTGLGTFRYVSTEPGLVNATQFAHSTPLQILAEAGALALIALAAVILLSMISMLRKVSNQPPETAALRAAIFGALVAAMIHNQLDSLMYHFEYGLACFALLGLGLQVSGEGSGPELFPARFRRAVAVGAVGVVALFGIAALQEWMKGSALAQAAAGDLAACRASLSTAKSLMPIDPEPYYLDGLVSGQPAEAADQLEAALRLGPTPKLYRALARQAMSTGDLGRATNELRGALRLDPNNLNAWSLLLTVTQQIGDRDGVVRVANEMLAVEKSPAYQVRAIPELVATETAAARVVLADSESDPDAKIKWLGEALEIYQQFLNVSVPVIKRTVGDDPSASMGGIGAKETQKILAQGSETATKLAEAYLARGDAAAAGRAREADAAFAAGWDGGSK